MHVAVEALDGGVFDGTVHAVDTLGHFLALRVTPADVGDRKAVARLAADIQDAPQLRSQLGTNEVCC